MMDRRSFLAGLTAPAVLAFAAKAQSAAIRRAQRTSELAAAGADIVGDRCDRKDFLAVSERPQSSKLPSEASPFAGNASAGNSVRRKSGTPWCASAESANQPRPGVCSSTSI
jgi:hypothetical protein